MARHEAVRRVHAEPPQRAVRKEARPRAPELEPVMQREQVARVQAVRASRDASEWHAALAAIRTAAGDATNLVPTIVRAVEARATVGEISDALRSVFGEHEEINV